MREFVRINSTRPSCIPLPLLIQSFIIPLTSTWLNLVRRYINTPKRTKLDWKSLIGIHIVRWLIRNFSPSIHQSFKYPLELVHRLTRFKSNGDARIGIVERRVKKRMIPFPLQFQIPPLPTSPDIRNCVMHAVQPPCSVTFICLSSKLASRRARKFEASNGTTQWGHTTYTWNVSAVIATVITVRQFADHCLCNTSINAASCVHTSPLSLSFSLSFSTFLRLSRSHDLSVVCVRGLVRKNLTTTPLQRS